jgi:hypothetical protein
LTTGVLEEWIFNIKNINDVEVKCQYEHEITKIFPIFENLEGIMNSNKD